MLAERQMSHAEAEPPWKPFPLEQKLGGRHHWEEFPCALKGSHSWNQGTSRRLVPLAGSSRLTSNKSVAGKGWREKCIKASSVFVCFFWPCDLRQVS